MTTSSPLKTGDKPKRLKRALGNVHPAILIIGGNAIILAGAALLKFGGAEFLAKYFLHHSGWLGDWITNRGPANTHGYHPDPNSPDGVHHLGKDVHHFK